MFACFAFGFHYSADFLACVFRIPLVDDIEKRGKITVLLVCAVYAVVDSDKPHAFLHKQDFLYRSRLSDRWRAVCHTGLYVLSLSATVLFINFFL